MQFLIKICGAPETLWQHTGCTGIKFQLSIPHNLVPILEWKICLFSLYIFMFITELTLYMLHTCMLNLWY
jgi:hypothetical protein